LSADDFPRPPEARLASLLDSLFNGVPLTNDVREWMLKSFFHYLHHGGAEPLDRFLGLSPINAGERSLSTRLGLLKRDLLLADALDQIGLDPSVSDWTRCVRLAKEIATFEGNAWPLYRHHQSAPAHWPAWKKSLLAAFQVGMRVPRTARGLYGMKKQVQGVSFRSPGMKLLTSLTQIQPHDKDLVQHQSTEQQCGRTDHLR
jgi:hypothetical protein